MKDIDLLVPAERWDAICRCLELRGARPCFPGGAVTRVATHHERSFLIENILVEVHQAFIQRQRHQIDYAGILQRRVPFEAAAV